MNEIIAIHSEYPSELGDELFSKKDHSNRELNDLIGEVIQECIRARKPINYDGLIETLSDITPDFIQISSGSVWEERTKERWENEIKPKLSLAISNYFLNGGQDERNNLINEFLTNLRNLCIDIEGEEKLLEVLSVGDWQTKLMQLTAQGRPYGVILKSSKKLSLEAFEKVMLPFGFSNRDVISFKANLRNQINS